LIQRPLPPPSIRGSSVVDTPARIADLQRQLDERKAQRAVERAKEAQQHSVDQSRQPLQLQPQPLQPQQRQPQQRQLQLQQPSQQQSSQKRLSAGSLARRAPSCGSLSDAKAAREPVGVTRAKQWTPEVENAFRLQEAGYRSVEDMLAIGLDEPEFWPEGYIRKLPTRKSIENGSRVLLYFRRTPECDARRLHTVKIYRY